VITKKEAGRISTGKEREDEPREKKELPRRLGWMRKVRKELLLRTGRQGTGVDSYGRRRNFKID